MTHLAFLVKYEECLLLARDFPRLNGTYRDHRAVVVLPNGQVRYGR